MADVLQQVKVEEVSPRNGAGSASPAPVDAPQPPTTDQRKALDEAGNGAPPAAPKRQRAGSASPAPVDAPQPPTTDQRKALDEAGNGAPPAAPKRQRLANVVVHPLPPPRYVDDDPLIPKCPSCRADLCYYTLEEQDVIACQNLDCLYVYINKEICGQVELDLNQDTSQAMGELIRRAAREISTYYSYKSNLRKKIKAVKRNLKRERDGQA